MNTPLTHKNESKETVYPTDPKDTLAHTRVKLSLSLRESAKDGDSLTKVEDSIALANAMHRASQYVQAGKISWRCFDVVVRLSLLDDPTQSQIAESMGVSISTVRRSITEAEQAGIVVRVFLGGRTRPLVVAEHGRSQAPLGGSQAPLGMSQSPFGATEIYTEDPEAPEAWMQYLDQQCPHWSSISLKPKVKQKIQMVFEKNKPQDLSDETWLSISRANYPLLYIGKLANADGFFIESVKSKPLKKPLRKPHNKPHNNTHAFQSKQPSTKAPEPDDSVDPAPISRAERKALYAQMVAKIKGHDHAESQAKVPTKRTVSTNTDEFTKRRTASFGLRSAF